MVPSRNCIYCKQNKPKNREHIIPKAFIQTDANFSVIENLVCIDCNKFLGKNIDFHFARESIEGISRYNRGIRSNKSYPQKHISMLLPDKNVFGHFRNVHVWIDGSSGNVRLRTQVILKNKKTSATCYFFNESELLKIKKSKWTEKGIQLEIKIIVDQSENLEEVAEKFLKLFEKVGIPIDREKLQALSPPKIITTKNKVEIKLEAEIQTFIIRAYSKILFNYAAKELSYESIMKKEWDGIRSFILTGEKTPHYELKSGPFFSDEQVNVYSLIGHNGFKLRIWNQNGNVVGQVQFYNMVIYEVVLIKHHTINPEFAGIFTRNGYSKAYSIPMNTIDPISYDTLGRLRNSRGGFVRIPPAANYLRHLILINSLRVPG